MVTQVDDLGEKIAQRTADILHRYLDPDIPYDWQHTTFTKIIQHDAATRYFAKLPMTR